MRRGAHGRPFVVRRPAATDEALADYVASVLGARPPERLVVDDD